MNGRTVDALLQKESRKVHGEFVTFLGEDFYRISNPDRMNDFFMTITSSSDVWNYIWSNGGLTAGRKDCDHAVFPYYTADKVSDGRTNTGTHTLIRVPAEGKIWLWEPFSVQNAGLWNCERNLYKNTQGSKLYFEEINHDLGLAIQYGWLSSDAFGLVRHVRIFDTSGSKREIAILDGCRNILPACVTADFQNNNSVLLDAYKKTDLDTESGMAIFSVTSIVTDKAEPSEGLFANVSWFTARGTVSVLPEAPEYFSTGKTVPPLDVLKGKRPVFYLEQHLHLEAGETRDWYQVFDTALDGARISALTETIRDRDVVRTALEHDITKCNELLESFIARSDGLQHSADNATCVHHKANVLFNIMRGGLPVSENTIDCADLRTFMNERNPALAKDAAAYVPLSGEYERGELKKRILASGNPQLVRLFLEYLPLTFSRRHGDPSRPWNRFSIELKDSRGKQKLNYQGNWRDIFQNWEALAWSWPCYLEHMIAKFLNAMTADGYNPYRITRNGIDWEVQEPDNPWSNIGYWGDHQVIYLAKLLELQNRFSRDHLLEALDTPLYSSANVPYRIKGYADILQNPRSTIIFDEAAHERIIKAAEREGSDARLLHDKNGEVALVSMTTKFISILCAKMSNYVPGGGIWLNTQRPEWNDANNALAGYGLSMVTLYYIRRFISFLSDLYRHTPIREFGIPEETAELFTALARHFSASEPEALEDSARRKLFVDTAGRLHERARESLYREGWKVERVPIRREEILQHLEAFMRHCEYAIGTNRREDGLFHSYNTLSIEDTGMHVHTLQEMLEGQVAVISSGMLDSAQVISLMRSLKHSALFTADQYSYILYPNRELPLFTAKNRVNAADIERIPLLRSLLDKDDHTIAHIDAQGIAHFNPSFKNSRDLDSALDGLLSGTQDDGQSRKAVHELYERTFNHRSFTGRSGTFYAYEGLGSIYWHMVAKLMLAVQEYALKEEKPELKKELAALYYDIRAGIGFNKTPQVYGAFPTDPYSHTPAGQGAKQPGMTGQVKEEVITRWGELGITIRDGTLAFKPDMLRKSEFGPSGTITFSLCGTPLEYRLVKEGRGITVTYRDGSSASVPAETLSADDSRKVFTRSGDIRHIAVTIAEPSLLLTES